MSCPLCGYGYRCPCSNCMSLGDARGLRPWIRLDGEFQDFEACPCCGTMMHLDQWEDLSWDEAKVQYKYSNQSGGCLSGIVDSKDRIIK